MKNKELFVPLSINTANGEADVKAYGLSIKKLETANYFYGKYEIYRMINPGNIEQQALFILHFARYLILKEGREVNRSVRNPLLEKLKVIPFFERKQIKLLEIDHVNNLAVNKLQQSALIQAKSVVKKHAFESENGREYTMPFTIERAANQLSIAYVDHKKASKKKLKNAIEEVKATFK